MTPSPHIMLGCLLFLATGSVGSSSLWASDNVDWARVHSLTVRGIDEIYSLEMEKAEKTLDEVIKMAPNDPRGYFFQSMIFFWTFSLNKDDNAHKRFLELSEQVIAICEKDIERDKSNALASFYLGGIYGYRGLAYQRSGSFLKAAWDGRKGYSYLKDAVNGDSTLYDAQMGFGLFNYLVAKVPKSFRWILNIIGFNGDLEGGLQNLRMAAEKGVYTRSEASFFLAQFLYAERRHDEAYKYMNALIAKYRENTLFLSLHAQWEFRQERIESAMESARKAVAINEKKKVKFGDEFAHLILGTAHFALNEFDQALTSYQSYLQKIKNKDLVSNVTYYRLGLSYEMLGQRQQAVTTYQEMKKGSSLNQWDASYLRRGEERVKRPLDEVDILLVKSDNAMTLRRHSVAKDLYGTITKKNSLDDERLGIALYGLVQIAQEEERYDELQNQAERLLKLKLTSERWLLPHTHFRLGQVYAKQGLLAEARREFEAIDNYDKYDFQARLESRVKEELEKLAGVN